MTEEEQQKHNEDDEVLTYVAHNMQVNLMGSIALTLLRIARAQERLVALSEMDLEAALEAEIESRAQAKAEEMDAAKTKRSFLGKKT